MAILLGLLSNPPLKTYHSSEASHPLVQSDSKYTADRLLVLRRGKAVVTVNSELRDGDVRCKPLVGTRRMKSSGGPAYQ